MYNFFVLIENKCEYKLINCFLYIERIIWREFISKLDKKSTYIFAIDPLASIYLQY